MKITIHLRDDEAEVIEQVRRLPQCALLSESQVGRFLLHEAFMVLRAGRMIPGPKQKELIPTPPIVSARKRKPGRKKK